MPSNVIAAAVALAEALKNSPQYTEYLAAKNKLEQDSDLSAKVDEYRREHIEYQKNLVNGKENPDRERILSFQYSKLMLKEVSESYLISEEKLLNLINEIHGALEEVYSVLL